MLNKSKFAAAAFAALVLERICVSAVTEPPHTSNYVFAITVAHRAQTRRGVLC